MGMTNLDSLTLSGVLVLPGSGQPIASDVAIGDGKQIKPDGAPATSTAAAATIDKQSGKITTEPLVTAAGAVYSMTLTNALIVATSSVLVSAGLASATQGELSVVNVKPAVGTCVIAVKNTHATLALNGTISISFLVLNPQ